jgi:hypothetical protein
MAKETIQLTWDTDTWSKGGGVVVVADNGALAVIPFSRMYLDPFITITESTEEQVRVLVPKTTHHVRFLNETESSVEVVISPKA